MATRPRQLHYSNNLSIKTNKQNVRAVDKTRSVISQAFVDHSVSWLRSLDFQSINKMANIVDSGPHAGTTAYERNRPFANFGIFPRNGMMVKKK